MKGKIGFESLEVVCIIGVNPEERTHLQTLYIDLEVEVDVSACIKSDSIEDALDYQLLADVCSDFAKNGNYQLLEALAGDILISILQTYAVFSAWIRIKKPNAFPTAKCSIVEMELVQ